MTRPFRFGVVAPLTTDVPTWLTRVRRIADSGYSTLLMPDVPQWQPAPGPTLAFTDQKSFATPSVLVALAPVEGLMTMTDATELGPDEATFIAAVRSDDTARVRTPDGAPPA